MTARTLTEIMRRLGIEPDENPDDPLDDRTPGETYPSRAPTRWERLRFSNPNEFDGLTLPQLLFEDPGHFFFCFNKGAFRLQHWRIEEQAKLIHHRATRIELGDGHVVDYAIKRSGCLHDIRFRSCSTKLAEDTGYIRNYRRAHLDMSFPLRFQPFNKTGMRTLIKRMRGYFFDDVGLTKRVVEEFFDDERNFLPEL